MTLRRWTVPLSVVVVVAGVTLLALWLARGGAGDNVRPAARPHVLHLASASTVTTAMSTTSTELTAPAQPYDLVGTLPPGTPNDQSLWRLRSATADDARQVAEALRLPGAMQRVDGGWALRDGSNRLVVRDDGSWSYGMDCSPDTPVSDEDVNVGCASAGAVAVDPTVTTPVPSYPTGPSESGARATASEVFDRLGITDASTVVFTGDPMATVQASPSVHGLASSGWVTTVQVDGSNNVVSADGWLSGPAQDASYPVIPARTAFDALQTQPRPELMLCAQRPDGKPGCADIPPAEVTGATLGVMLDQDGGHPVLVPAWLFTVKGQDAPVGQVAVDPSYLSTPASPGNIVPPSGG